MCFLVVKFHGITDYPYFFFLSVETVKNSDANTEKSKSGKFLQGNEWKEWKIHIRIWDIIENYPTVISQFLNISVFIVFFLLLWLAVCIFINNTYISETQLQLFVEKCKINQKMINRNREADAIGDWVKFHIQTLNI